MCRISFRTLDGSDVNDFVRGSKGVFRPHCASAAHLPRAPARVDRTRTFGKSDFVQMTFSGASNKTSFFPKIVVFYPVWVLRVACFLCVCPCVCISVCCGVHSKHSRVSTQHVPLCTFKTSPCIPAPRAHTCCTEPWGRVGAGGANKSKRLQYLSALESSGRQPRIRHNVNNPLLLEPPACCSVLGQMSAQEERAAKDGRRSACIVDTQRTADAATSYIANRIRTRLNVQDRARCASRCPVTVSH